MIAREIYDARGLTWDYWCALTAETFAANQLGVMPEDQWQDWASAVAGLGRFPGVPDGRGFDAWQDWAAALNNSLRR